MNEVLFTLATIVGIVLAVSTLYVFIAGLFARGEAKQEAPEAAA